jgi:hypothetical protein
VLILEAKRASSPAPIAAVTARSPAPAVNNGGPRQATGHASAKQVAPRRTTRLLPRRSTRPATNSRQRSPRHPLPPPQPDHALRGGDMLTSQPNRSAAAPCLRTRSSPARGHIRWPTLPRRQACRSLASAPPTTPARSPTCPGDRSVRPTGRRFTRSPMTALGHLRHAVTDGPDGIAPVRLPAMQKLLNGAAGQLSPRSCSGRWRHWPYLHSTAYAEVSVSVDPSPRCRVTALHASRASARSSPPASCSDKGLAACARVLDGWLGSEGWCDALPRDEPLLDPRIDRG